MEPRHWTLWIFCIFWLILIEIFGNFGLIATFIYERFGMDPQKRTITNQLLTQITLIIFVINVIDLPLVVFITLLGPICIFLEFLLHRNGCQNCLLLQK